MAHTVAHAQEQFESRKEVRNVTIILSVLTLVELALGFWMYKAGLEGFVRGAVKGAIVILMLAKAFYIVAYFMHLGHEIKNFIMTIVVPLFLFVWFIIAFLYDGNSYKHLRNDYDRYHNEQSRQKAPNQESHNADDLPKHKKPAME
jgi:cytochrome c oxidase subunit IV